MMRFLKVILLTAPFVLSFAVLPASAQNNANDRTRCAILGPMTVSAYFGLLENASKGDRERNRDAVATLSNIVSLYATIGCPMLELEATLDCLTGMAMAGEIREGPGPAAQACMSEAGLPRP